MAAAKLIDFGLSKITKQDPDKDQETLIREFAGKYSFSSPEQFGIYNPVDARSDIYSLGLTLAAAALGRPLDMGRTFEDALRARQAVPDLANVPAVLRPWLLRMLEPNPANRPHSIAVLLADWGEVKPFAVLYLVARIAILVVLMIVVVYAVLRAFHFRFPTEDPSKPVSGERPPIQSSLEPSRVPLVTSSEALLSQFNQPHDSPTSEKMPVPPDPVITPSSDIPAMVRVVSGWFAMGSNNDPDAYQDEVPHQLRMQQFAISRYEVSVAEFKRFVEASGYVTVGERANSENRGCITLAGGTKDKRELLADKSWRDPRFRQDDAHPVVCVALADAYAYAGWLSKSTGRRFRLPTEAEWEYAARAGTGTRFFWGDTFDQVHANCRDDVCPDRTNYPQATVDGFPYTSPRGSFTANGWGIFDVLGNVSEWTCSLYSKAYGGLEKSCVADASIGKAIVTRGGNWFDLPKFLRVSMRGCELAWTRASTLGFRVVEDLEDDADAEVKMPLK